jgi:hypothetical protein
VLGSELVGGLVILPITLLGAAAGALVAGGARLGDKTLPEAEKASLRKRVVIGAAVGAGAGLLGSIYPSLAVQRAVLRSPACPRPGLGRIFVSNLAKGAAVGAVTAGGRAIDPTVGNIANVGAFFATVPIAQAILKDA